MDCPLPKSKVIDINVDYFIRYQSKIIGLYLGKYPVVTIYDYHIAKELFSREDLTGRPDNFAYRNRMLGEKQGM